MLFIAWKMLVGDRIKYLSLIVGIAFSTLLIGQQAGTYAGLTSWIRASVSDLSAGIDLWVMEPEVESVDDVKPMRDTAVDIVRGVPGVLWAAPLFKGSIALRLPDGTLRRAPIVGLEDGTYMGGPTTLRAGSLQDLSADGAVILDAAAVDDERWSFVGPDGVRRKLQVGDRIVINDNDAVVVGISELGQSFFDAPVYTTYTRALRFAPPERRQLAFVLVGVAPGSNSLDVASQIESATGLKARTPAGFTRLTEDYVNSVIGLVFSIGVIIVLAMGIGLAVTAQTFFNFTLDNSRYFAALKANGMTDFQLIRVVSLQAGIVCMLGFGIGIGLVTCFGLATTAAGGKFPFLLTPGVVGLVAALIGGVALVATVVSLFRVIRLEPAMVFRA
jgi:putative ABC transport system permease protein